MARTIQLLLTVWCFCGWAINSKDSKNLNQSAGNTGYTAYERYLLNHGKDLIKE